MVTVQASRAIVLDVASLPLPVCPHDKPCLTLLTPMDPSSLPEVMSVEGTMGIWRGQTPQPHDNLSTEDAQDSLGN